MSSSGISWAICRSASRPRQIIISQNPTTHCFTGHMHLAQTQNHASIWSLGFLQAGYPSCHPTNSIIAIALKSGHTKFSHIWSQNLPKTGLIADASEKNSSTPYLWQKQSHQSIPPLLVHQYWCYQADNLHSHFLQCSVVLEMSGLSISPYLSFPLDLVWSACLYQISICYTQHVKRFHCNQKFTQPSD